MEKFLFSSERGMIAGSSGKIQNLARFRPDGQPLGEVKSLPGQLLTDKFQGQRND
jgi:hypothetical protein